MKTSLKKFAFGLGVLAFAASSSAAQFGAALKTKGYEDVVVLDSTTLNLVVGGDDGVAASPLFNAMVNAQRTGPNKSDISLTERVFADYLPKPSANVTNPKVVDVQNLLLKRKVDVIDAKRYLFSVQMEPYFDMQSKNANRDTLVVRDNLGRYAVRLRTDSDVFGQYWTKDSETKEVSFRLCYRTDGAEYNDFQSNHGRNEHCLGIPEFKGLNLPTGFFVSDISKFGDLGWTGMIGGQKGTSTLRAGIIVTPDGRSGTAGGTMQGRNFAAHELVIWDVATFQVVAGPFQLKAKNPDVIYATNNCQMKTNGLALVVDPAGNCGQLNPTLPAGTTIEVRY
jgi:hypothetical protein